MDSANALLIVGIIIVVVILFNIGLVISLTGPSTREQMRLLGKLARGTRNPWKNQNEELSELRDRVAQFEADEHEAEEQNG
jgi:hypothetical protein